MVANQGTRSVLNGVSLAVYVLVPLCGPVCYDPINAEYF